MVENGQRRSSRIPFVIALLAACAMFTLYAPALYWPVIQMDDFPMLAESWTWQRVRENLWRPFNEHVAPLTRLSIWALAGSATSVPWRTALQGPLAVLFGMGVLYLFIRNERGSSYLGLVAIILFGVTTAYHEAVAWYAAGFTLLALDTTLLALLVAQRWRQHGGWQWCVLTAGLCACAPAWFASGILAGPLVAIYFLTRMNETASTLTATRGTWKRLLDCLVPLAGTCLYLVLAIPQNVQRILHLEHYGGRTAFEAFDLRIGAARTARSLIDHSLLGTCGVSMVAMPVPVVVLGLCILAGASVWWWRRAPRRDLLILGLAFILFSGLLIHSARSAWPYEYVHSWTRYDVFPHAGLVLIICGGLHRPIEGCCDSRQKRILIGLITVLFLMNLPRGVVMSFRLESWEAAARPIEQISRRWRAQQAVLEKIETTDAFCRAHDIDRATAREVLGHLTMPECAECDGWLILRGSDAANPVSADEARRLFESSGLDR